VCCLPAGLCRGNGVANADPSGSNFDPSVAGDTITVDELTLTVVDVRTPEYDLSAIADGGLPTLTGNIRSSANGDGDATNVSGLASLGIDNSSINDSDFDLIGDVVESGDFNPGESLIFIFDRDVEFLSIELESVAPADSFDVLVDGISILETQGDNNFIDDLGGLAGLTIPAGTEITFFVDGVLETATGGPATSLRVETFEVHVKSVPEPSSLLALAGMVGLVAVRRRR